MSSIPDILTALRIEFPGIGNEAALACYIENGNDISRTIAALNKKQSQHQFQFNSNHNSYNIRSDHSTSNNISGPVFGKINNKNHHKSYQKNYHIKQQISKPKPDVLKEIKNDLLNNNNNNMIFQIKIFMLSYMLGRIPEIGIVNFTPVWDIICIAHKNFNRNILITSEIKKVLIKYFECGAIYNKQNLQINKVSVLWKIHKELKKINIQYLHNIENCVGHKLSGNYFIKRRKIVKQDIKDIGYMLNISNANNITTFADRFCKNFTSTNQIRLPKWKHFQDIVLNIMGNLSITNSEKTEFKYFIYYLKLFVS